MDDKSFNIRVPKRWVRVAMIVGVTALIVAPLTAIASHSFTDVPDTNTFHSDIEWMKDAGVTQGCNPPDNTEYCPDDNVTRGQMAAFMNRFAGYIGATDGTPAQADNATTADSATEAGNADTLDGKSSSVFVEEGEANTVTPAMTTGEPGVAQVNSGSFIDLTTTAVTDIDSITIDAPASGYVIVTLTTEAWMVHATGTDSELQIGVSASPSAFGTGEDHDVQTDSAAPSGTYVQTLGATKAFPVSEGSSTFYFLAQRISGGTTSQVGDYQMTATYVPTNYGTVATATDDSDPSDGE